MRAIGPIFAVLLGALGGAALVVVPVPPTYAQAGRTQAALDGLFDQLRSAPDAQSAHRVDQLIWLFWTTPADAELAARMETVLQARRVMDLAGAMEVIETIVTDYPDYAEGWNQRATVNFMLGKLEASLADIDKVLEFEPRHFGALAGKAMIHRQLGQEDLALQTMVRALDVHPFLPERALFPELAAPIVRL
jgi:tetratricopeptide (TPR) repeat protein